MDELYKMLGQLYATAQNLKEQLDAARLENDKTRQESNLRNEAVNALKKRVDELTAELKKYEPERGNAAADS